MQKRVGGWRGMVRTESLIPVAAVTIVAVLVLYPLGWLVRMSVSVAPENPSLTLQWYTEVYTSSTVLKCLVNSFLFAGGSSLMALIFGVSLAWIVVRTNTPLADKLEMIAILPFITMPYVGAIAWSLLASPRVGFLNKLLRALVGLSVERGPLDIFSLPGMIWVMGLFSTSYVFVFVASALRNMDPVLEEAAKVSGSGNFQVMRTITLPMILPAILSSTLLAFVVGMGNFGIPSLLGVPAQTLVISTLIYQKLAFWPTNFSLAAALGSMLFVISMLGMYLHGRILGSREFVTVTGKGFRPSRVDLGKFRYAALGFCIVYLTVSVGLPFFSLLFGSFTKYWTSDVRMDVLTLENYRWILFDYGLTWTGLRNSFLLATSAATGCMLLAVLVSWIRLRTDWRARRLLDYLSMVSVGIPGVVLAEGVMFAWIRRPVVLYGTIWILLVAYVTHFIPFGVRSASSGLRQIDSELEECSRICGASWFTTFRRVTLPLVRPALFGGWVLLFIMYMRELTMSIFLYSPGNHTAAVAIWELWDAGRFPKVSALSAILVFISVVGVLVARRLLGRDLMREMGG